MSEEYYQLNFSKYFKIVFRYKWLVILCLLISIIATLLAEKSRVPLYQAHTSFWVRGIKSDGLISEKIRQIFFIGRQEPFETTYGTQIEIMKSALILKDVVREIGLPSDTEESLRNSIKLLRSSVFISKIKDTTIIEVKAVNPSPDMAVKMANAVCRAYVDFNNKLFLEQEQLRLKSMEEQARLLREQMGKSNDLVTEKIKMDMYLLLMEKAAESRLNRSLGQSEQVKVIDEAKEVVIASGSKILKVFFMGIIGLVSGAVLALGIDGLIGKKKGA